MNSLQDRRILIKNGHVLDPSNHHDSVQDVLIVGREIAEIQPKLTVDDAQLLDATGLIVCPGLVDAQARMREPGHEYIATILSETKAAVANGCTTLITPPDTTPIIDSAAAAELIVNRAKTANTAKVFASGALTHGLRGETLAEMDLLKQAGCVALSNADEPITNSKILLHALQYAATIDLPVVLHPVDPWLNVGVAHDGAIATRYGLPTVAEESELIGLYRLLALVKKSGVKAIIGPLSSARSLDLIKQAKAEGLPIDVMTTIHHLMLTEIDCANFNNSGRVMPPLRTQQDKDALRQAVREGVINIICSDHRPWRIDDYLLPFELAKHGNSGVDTFLGVCLKLANEMGMTIAQLLPLITQNPANAFNLNVGSLTIGHKADLCLFDAQQMRRIKEDQLLSQGKNNAFIHWELPGVVKHTIKSGEIVFG